MPDFKPTQPEQEEVVLNLPDSQLEVKHFTEYSFNTNFLTPTDGWAFTVAQERLSEEVMRALKPGAAVKLTINGGVESSGYIDSIEITASRGSGTEWHIHGRDRLAQAVDACADPTIAFKEGQTLLDLMKTIFAPFGWSEEKHFIADQLDAKKDARTGALRNKVRRSDAKGYGRKAIREYQLHQVKPYMREGAFAFASRVAQRFGLWIWATPTGEQLAVSKPDFDTDPLYEIRRNYDGTTNVLEGSVKFDIADQPTHIVASGWTQSGEFSGSAMKAVYANTAVVGPDGGDSNVAPDAVQKYVAAGARVLGGQTFHDDFRLSVPRTKILYLADPESLTKEQLEAYARREMALLQRKALTVSYTVEGHAQDTPKHGFVPWTVDTIVRVDDDIADLHEDLYVLGRTFHKSRSGGTTTHLDLIRRNTLFF